MHCPRCNSTDCELMLHAPDAWDIHLCRHCLYTWRSSEPSAQSDYQSYDPRFRLSAQQLAKFIEMPPVPAAAPKART